MDPRRPTTLADIARELGITPAAVSKALRGALDISVETRERVQQKAREMNYRVNLTARSLSSRSTKLIGVVVPTFIHSFFGDVLTAASALLDTRGFQPIMTCTDENPEREAKQIDVLLSRQAEGLIVSTCQRDDRYGVFARAKELGVPVVMLGRNINPVTNSWVGSDNVAIADLATRHLIEVGRKVIAIVYGQPNSTSDQRIEGYKQALRAAGMPILDDYMRGGSEVDSTAEQAMRELLALSTPPDAVFCYNDAVAASCLRAILASGKRVPEDVALVGVGNTRFSDVMWAPLSTIDQSCDRIGEVAAAKLLHAIDTGEEAGMNFVPGRLIVRQSSAGR